jgi:hypothetical protein
MKVRAWVLAALVAGAVACGPQATIEPERQPVAATAPEPAGPSRPTTTAPPTTTTTKTTTTAETTTAGTPTAEATTTVPAPVTSTVPPPPPQAAATTAPPPAAPAARGGCTNGTYTNVDGNDVCRPAARPAGPPPGATAQCRDGTYSWSQHRQGTCSGHGGVAHWL